MSDGTECPGLEEAVGCIGIIVASAFGGCLVICIIICIIFGCVYHSHKRRRARVNSQGPPTAYYPPQPVLYPGYVYAVTTDPALSQQQLQPLPPYNDQPPSYTATQQQLQPFSPTIDDIFTTDLASSSSYVATTDPMPSQQPLQPLPPYNDQPPSYTATQQQLQPLSSTIDEIPTTDLASSSSYVATTNSIPSQQQLQPVSPTIDDRPTTDLASSSSYVATTDPQQQLRPVSPTVGDIATTDPASSPGYTATTDPASSPGYTATTCTDPAFSPGYTATTDPAQLHTSRCSPIEV